MKSYSKWAEELAPKLTEEELQEAEKECSRGLRTAKRVSELFTDPVVARKMYAADAADHLLHYVFEGDKDAQAIVLSIFSAIPDIAEIVKNQKRPRPIEIEVWPSSEDNYCNIFVNEK